MAGGGSEGRVGEQEAFGVGNGAPRVRRGRAEWRDGACFCCLCGLVYMCVCEEGDWSGRCWLLAFGVYCVPEKEAAAAAKAEEAADDRGRVGVVGPDDAAGSRRPT